MIGKERKEGKGMIEIDLIERDIEMVVEMLNVIGKKNIEITIRNIGIEVEVRTSIVRRIGIDGVGRGNVIRKLRGIIMVKNTSIEIETDIKDSNY